MLDFKTLFEAYGSQRLFLEKTWEKSPDAFLLDSIEKKKINEIGDACLAFYHACEYLYIRSKQGKSLLRNKMLLTPWVAEWIDRGKPDFLVKHSLNSFCKKQTPTTIRPDLLLCENGFKMTELDSVPGGLGVTHFLQKLYLKQENLVRDFFETLIRLSAEDNPYIVILVSEESKTYRPEFEYLVQEYSFVNPNQKISVCSPEDLIFTPNGILQKTDPGVTKISLIYRFFELFDFNQLPIKEIIEQVEGGRVKVFPPMRHFQEEKLNFALFYHPVLKEFWQENLSASFLQILKDIIPETWVIDGKKENELSGDSFLWAPYFNSKPIRSWLELANFSKKERGFVLKLSGFNENAWGARSVTIGNDCSQEEWGIAVKRAVESSKKGNLFIIQTFYKPKKITYQVYDENGFLKNKEGRVRICPYYLTKDDFQTQFVGNLVTICPADKKIIHGMSVAALISSR